jgi:hypothetical protein
MGLIVTAVAGSEAAEERFSWICRRFSATERGSRSGRLRLRSLRPRASLYSNLAHRTVPDDHVFGIRSVHSRIR